MMTPEERSAMMEGTARLFIENADKTCQGLTKDELQAKMLGTVIGAVAVAAASGLPLPNINAAINSIIADMMT